MAIFGYLHFKNIDKVGHSSSHFIAVSFNTQDCMLFSAALIIDIDKSIEFRIVFQCLVLTMFCIIARVMLEGWLPQQHIWLPQQNRCWPISIIWLLLNFQSFNCLLYSSTFSLVLLLSGFIKTGYDAALLLICSTSWY